ncbi:Si-specific NAD(P)(+) transhydrogenase [Alteraurantiacibacter buctensis]|uniref:Soluble pyridine nucleotide transhydrogenase n=1 Tax=Alteraurantiacibacter buctensis TaxID=1503981 RepID=A0A844YWK3_9SPHN|nr:Si-specific NAD(P)(+) transhydrogenase [Alteraurantiacibacter buctensis]MXO70123.1 Si-specific NAD(P)(+) transhydrogenase [Alteraurantiacibacter buctensis]
MAQYDFVVLGSGPAGRRAAIQAAKLGRSVLVVDDRSKVGGVSVHTGTIPSKTLRETALNLSGWRERGFYGRSYRAKADLCSDDLQMRMRRTFEHEVAVLEHQFARNGVHVMVGRGRFDGPGRVVVEREEDGRCFEQVVAADKVLIAVGTAPFRPPHIPFNDVNVFDSDSFIAKPRLPRSLTVVGGGVIGVEYATIFAALDVPVTLIDPRPKLLDFIDDEIVAHLVHLMRDNGVALRLGGMVDRIRFAANGNPVCMLEDGRQVSSEMVLLTSGRCGATASLDLASVGLEVDRRGYLEVDRTSFQTSVPGIYAAGDVVGFPCLASVSMEQGRAAACHAFGAPVVGEGASNPYGVYSVPELSSVGMTEQKVREAGIAYECGVARFRETSRGHIMGMDYGVLKLICEVGSRRVLGVHIVGEGASELIHIGQAVINLSGTVDYFVDNSFNYPTLAEGYKIAALDVWNRLQAQAAQVVELPAPARQRARRKAGRA